MGPSSRPAASSRPEGLANVEPGPLVAEVLRYWLALLRHEEALGRRPKVRRHAERTSAEPNLADPVPGQDYAKLPFSVASEFLVQHDAELGLELGSEWPAFFEDWLLSRYRRGDDEADAVGHLVAFPTVHLARDELAGVLRFPVELRWRGESGPFSAPTVSERRRRHYPPPPIGVTLVRPQSDNECDESQGLGEAESELPFFIDTRLLRDTLRIDAQRLDALFAQLKEQSPVESSDVIVAVTRLIESQGRLEAGEALDDAALVPRHERRNGGVAPVSVPTAARGSSPPKTADAPQDSRRAAPTDSRPLLTQLLVAVSARLDQIQAKAKAYAVALVIHADSSRTTWHLQKDLAVAQSLFGRGGLQAKAPVLDAYLSGRRLGSGEATCWGRWRGPALTSSQRQAAEYAVGSRLCAVQGPPGTGKTTMILSLAAHALVTRIGELARGGSMGTSVTVIASTNNRAVDNVIEPLSVALDDGALPLAIRAGSRQVIDQVTRLQFGRARRWLESSRMSEAEAQQCLEAELRRFCELRDEQNAVLEPLESYRAAQRQRDQLQKAILQHSEGQGLGSGGPRSSLLDGLPPAALALPPGAAARRRALRALRNLVEPLIDGSALAEKRGKKTLRRVRRHFKRIEELHFAEVREALGVPLASHLPPDPEPQAPEEALEAWEEGFEALIGEVTELIEALEHWHRQREKQRQLEKMKAELAALDAKLACRPRAPSLEEATRIEARHQDLFEAAARVREVWARAHRAELLAALGRASHVAEASRSLRSFMESDSEAKSWLLRLFPTWGTTLLSMGNVFPAEPSSLDRVIIDEAGQCHPAYALSALLRARSALVIGDTFQLEPVFELREADEQRILRSLGLRTAARALEPYRCFEASTASAQRLADRAVERRPTLVDHFRCQSQIAAISEQLCGYGLITHTPRRSRVAEAPFLSAPLLHVSVDGVQQRFAGSWVNEAELEQAIDLVRCLLASGIGADEVGVITPYRGQLERLWRSFREARLPVERLWSDGEDSPSGWSAARGTPGLALGTVHRFQGGERSIMLFTTTLTRRDALGFVDGRVNLVNVAASRAREHLITIGHTPTLRLGQHTRYLVEAAKALVLPGSPRCPTP